MFKHILCFQFQLDGRIIQRIENKYSPLGDLTLLVPPLEELKYFCC